MCTVTFLPKGKSSYILTSNRDETPKRAALAPAAYAVYGKEIFFPKDPLAGGTWIATDKQQFTLCLLNGAFEKHHHKPPYKLSRGIMVLDFFKYSSAQSFIEQYDFSGIEPFTLILIESNHSLSATELVWDEVKLHVRVLDVSQPQIWSSSTLYPEAVRMERKHWFKLWLEAQSNFQQNEIIDFHKTGGKGDEWNDFVMNRGGKVQTVSVTSIEKDSDYTMVYEDLLK
ncbi:NRDE family protein [Roseivirga sp.]|uniref:NRDE family protein n=1 Tax=Roseivirga sp. TaxID=1964215 RepID=UPI002B265486|nr:NRDE family protein [Roseivirga sp.]